MTHRSGPAPVPASHSRRPAAAEASTTSAISGPSGPSSSPSAALQSSLESRLRARLDGLGSTLYALTWKHWDMPSGPPICALRASVRRTSGSGSSGWPSPLAHERGAYTYRNSDPLQPTLTLDGTAQLAGWATPTSAQLGNTLEQYRAMKANMTSGARTAITHLAQQAQLAESLEASGPTLTGSGVKTAGGGQLNPDLPRWLMGLPAAWAACAPTATRSSRRSRRSSSKP